MLFDDKTTVLFDLDGTLLLIEQEEFIDKYFKALSAEFTDLAPRKRFIKLLMKATETMIKNKEPKFNEQVFKETFFSLIEVDDREEVIDRFEDFYREEFPKLKAGLTFDSSLAREIVRLFKEAGYQLVLATSPLFPRLAVEERLNWIGIEPEEFSLITTYENMHYSKPYPEYYQEIMEKLALSPKDCIMVGNDLQEDMIAGKLGMQTFLIEDYLLNGRVKEKIVPDWRGSLSEFRNLAAKELK